MYLWSLFLFPLTRWGYNNQPTTPPWLPTTTLQNLHILSHNLYPNSRSCFRYLYHEPRRFMIDQDYGVIDYQYEEEEEKSVDHIHNHDKDEDEAGLEEGDDEIIEEEKENESFDYTSFQQRIQQDLVNNDTLLAKFPPGKPSGFVIVQQYPVPTNGFHSNFTFTCSDITYDEIQRLHLQPTNVTLPVALMLLDRLEYPSFSRARKACRYVCLFAYLDTITFTFSFHG